MGHIRNRRQLVGLRGHTVVTARSFPGACSAPAISSSTVYHYRLFGGVLRSDFEIPELRLVTSAPPSWTLTSTRGAPPVPDGELLGTDVVTGDVRVRLYRSASGLRMAFDDTGCFDVSANGRMITWIRGTDVNEASARADLTGRVLAAALHAAGTLCLHGSAVVTRDKAIGFVAPKFHGKSTLALALARAGAKLLTDDTLPVAAGAPAIARPGLHVARLWPDSAERVGLGAPSDRTGGQKQLFNALPAGRVTHEFVPMDALYLLVPMREPLDGQAAWRDRLAPAESALVMIGHAKLAPLLGKSEAPVLFRQAAEIAATVPVYRLNVVRDLDRLGAVVDAILSWHSDPSAVPAS